MTNRDILNRELINHLFVRLFNQILDIEGRYMSGKGIEDLSLSELHIIDVISSLLNPAMSNIASKATLTNGTITTAIKKLEVKGYVKRRKDDLDRRIIRVELTTKGNRACKVHREFHEEMVNSSFRYAFTFVRLFEMDRPRRINYCCRFIGLAAFG